MYYYNNKFFIWMDLEMTGIDINHAYIIEIAAVITDKNLNIIDKHPSIAIYQNKNILNTMNSWCIKTHTSSGLISKVKKSSTNEKQAENKILSFVQKYTKKNKAILCGNSIWHDRKFLFKYMPNLEQHFHYRMIDVSTLKIIAQNMKPDIIKNIKKNNNHTALEDILDSINELKYYYQNLLYIK